MILIECPASGERCVVAATAGYEGWKVVARNVAPPPSDDCTWCEASGSWRVDAAAQATAARLRAMRDPARLLAIIDELTERVAAIEGLLSGSNAA